MGPTNMDFALRQEMQERNLQALVENGAFQFTDTFFPYTSGQIGPYYVQSAVVTKDGDDFRQACEDLDYMVSRVIGKNDIISGGESRDWIFSFRVATEVGAPHFMLYKDGKTLGADVNGKKVIHVADLNNEGSSPRDMWVPAIRGAGGKIEDIFFYVDRMEDGVEVMKDLGLQSHAVVELNAGAWDYLRKNEVVTPEQYTNLTERGSTREERDAWAIKMLRSDAGIETLANLFRVEKTFGKAKKILEAGYPEIAPELTERLKSSGLKMVDF
jgi:orotate phosphoribosyltransferase